MGDVAGWEVAYSIRKGGEIHCSRGQGSEQMDPFERCSINLGAAVIEVIALLLNARPM
jgi:hypothetical protein